MKPGRVLLVKCFVRWFVDQLDSAKTPKGTFRCESSQRRDPGFILCFL